MTLLPFVARLIGLPTLVAVKKKLFPVSLSLMGKCIALKLNM